MFVALNAVIPSTQPHCESHKCEYNSLRVGFRRRKGKEYINTVCIMVYIRTWKSKNSKKKPLDRGGIYGGPGR
jgi:hypothetical protein